MSSYPHFNDEETGILTAQRALVDVRDFLQRQRRTRTSSEGTSSNLGSNDDSDEFLVLQFQLENLEDMLREITDARFARSLFEGGGGAPVARDGNVENLWFIVTTAREIQTMTWPSNTKVSREPEPSSSGTTLGKVSGKTPLKDNLRPTSRTSSLGSRTELEWIDEYYSNGLANASLEELGVFEDEDENESDFSPTQENDTDIPPLNITKGKQRATSSIRSFIQDAQAGSSTSRVGPDPDSPTSPLIEWSTEEIASQFDENGNVHWFHKPENTSRSPSPTTSWSAALRQFARKTSDSSNEIPSEPQSPRSAPLTPQSEIEYINFGPNVKNWDERIVPPTRSILDPELSDPEDTREYVIRVHEIEELRTSFSRSSTPLSFASSSPRSTHFTSCIACCDPDSSDPLDFLSVPCGHMFCRSCIEHVVSAYVNDESLHPLQCCKTTIPSSALQIFLFGTDTLSMFQEKYEEYNTPFDGRTYCPQPGCSRFLKASKPTTSPRSSINNDRGGSETAYCSHCLVWVCTLCKELAHPGEGCHVKQNTALLHDLAKAKEWQTCSNCKSIVERAEGCLHIVCRCGFEFCYRCGEKYTGPGMCGH